MARGSLDYSVTRAVTSSTLTESRNGSASNSEKELQKKLETEHPLYTKMKKSWQDSMHLYLSENIEDFIFRHMREKEPFWLRRRQRAYFFNYVESIVNLITSFIYSKTVLRQWASPEERERRVRALRSQFSIEDYQQSQMAAQQQTDFMTQNPELAKQAPAPSDELPVAVVEARVEDILNSEGDDMPELQEFWRNVDMRGTSIDDFSKLLFICTQIFGHVDVFIDMDSIPEDKPLTSEQDRKERGIRPYCFIIFPLDLLNWEVGPDGKFMWVRWREELLGDTDPWGDRSTKKSYRYFTWTREDWVVHVVKYKGTEATPHVEEVAKGPNALGEIPLVRFFNRKHMQEPLMGVSAVKDIGKINIEILNICSLLDEEVYQKMLNILVMQNPTERKGAVEIGANNVLLWEGEGQAPFYLAPSSEPGTFMMELVKMCVGEIYRIAKLGGDTGVLAREAQSGIAYTWEFNQTNRMLADKADMMERGETELHRLWAMWLGLEWEGIIDYPDDFNVEKFNEEVQNVTLVKQAVRSPEFKRIMEKRIASRAMAKAPLVQRARVNAEIDVMPEEKQQFFPQF